MSTLIDRRKYFCLTASRPVWLVRIIPSRVPYPTYRLTCQVSKRDLGYRNHKISRNHQEGLGGFFPACYTQHVAFGVALAILDFWNSGRLLFSVKRSAPGLFKIQRNRPPGQTISPRLPNHRLGMGIRSHRFTCWGGRPQLLLYQ